MIELFGWVALAATCIAAIITAANLGARITGYGFAVFFIGAVAWCVVGAATGQRQLLWSNLFLALVDLLGIWRWLYRRARAEDAVAREKEEEGAESVFALDDLTGKPVTDIAGDALGIVEGALADRRTGKLLYLIVRPDGAAIDGAGFKRVPWRLCRRVYEEGVTTELSAPDFHALQSA